MPHTNQQRAAGLFYLKAGFLLFWTCWLGLACSTNITDFMAAFNDLPSDWKFHSSNYSLVKSVVSIYQLPSIVINFMFLGVILFEASITLLFLTAFISFIKRRNAWAFINIAFMLNIALWGIFLISEEIFLAYNLESVHVGLAILQIIMLIAMHLLPEG